jgi:hypothetical protein
LRTPRNNLGFEFAIPEKDALPGAHLAPRADQRVPSVGIDLPGEQDLDLAGQVLPSRGARRRSRMHSGASTEQPGGNHPRVVENHKFISSEECRKMGEQMILEGTAHATDQKKARGVAAVERALCNLPGGEVVVQFVEPHGGSLAAFQVGAEEQVRDGNELTG